MAESKRSIFSGMQILIDEKWVKDRAVVIEDGVIHAIIPTEMIKHHLPAIHYEYSETHYLVPGFIDLHIHGARGKDVMDDEKESLFEISRALAAEGVTGFLATTMTASPQKIESVLKTIANVDVDGAAILGVHLEGPFISSAKKGAHLHHEVKPEISLIRDWQKATNNIIKIVTVAPELPDMLPFIKALRDMDVIASIGHTHATFEETMAAINAGCTQATHLFNAMRGIHHRDPGATTALLLSDKVSAELILDGVHLHPAMAELAFRMKGKDRLLLVTDAMRAKCLGDGQYELGGQTVEVKDGKVTLADGTLAGSVLRMPEAIKHMEEFTPCSLVEAIQMATLNPAQVLRIDNRKGEIAVNKDADLVVLNHRLEVDLTIRAGIKIYKRDSENGQNKK